jgi:uncharacterized protein YqeY
MNLLEQLQHDLKDAMRSRDQERTGTIRMAISALKNAQMAMVEAEYTKAAAAARAANPGVEPEVDIDRTIQLSDAAMIDVISKEVKRRHDAAELYRKGDRLDLAEAEEKEALILEGYLPRQLTADELRPIIQKIVEELGVSGATAMGKVMPVVMQQLKGKADGRVINQVVREVLG